MGAGTVGTLSIEATGIADINVTTSSVSSIHLAAENGDITAGFGAFADLAASNLIGTHSGSVALSLPSAGIFSVQAVAEESVSFGTVPSVCTEEAAADNSKTVTCNSGGSNIEVFAEGLSSTVTATIE